MVKKGIFASIIFLAIFLIFINFISLVSAGPSTWCEGATYNFTCKETINQSCTLTGNVSINDSTCFQVINDGKYNITVDCNGYWIIGNDASSTNGISILSSNEKIKIQNCNIINFYNGIYVDGSRLIDIVNNSFISSDYGISFFYVIDANISGNTAYGNYKAGIAIEDGSGKVSIKNNTVYNNGNGIYVSTNEENEVINNTAYNNLEGIGLFRTNNIKIYKNNLNNNTDYSLFVIMSNFSNVSENYVNGSQYGIYIRSFSNQNLFDHNNINNPEIDGIYSNASAHNNFTNNYIYNASNDCGILLDDDSNNNIIIENNFDTGIYGICLLPSATVAEGNLIRDNEFSILKTQHI